MRKLLMPIMFILLIACNTSSGNYFRTDKLPNGWVVCPSSRMPPNDRTLWWRANPIVLTGEELKKYNDSPSEPTHAVMLRAEMYINQNIFYAYVALQILIYNDEELAHKDFIMLSKVSLDNEYVKYDKGRKMIFMMTLGAVPNSDKDVFIDLFNDI